MERARSAPAGEAARLVWHIVAEARHDLEGALGLVERVEVEAGHQLGVDQLLAHVGDVLQPKLDEGRLLLVAGQLRHLKQASRAGQALTMGGGGVLGIQAESSATSGRGVCL